MDCLVAKPIKDFGIKGLSIFKAVWIVTTPPTKNDMKDTMPKEPIIKSSMSLKTKRRITDHLVGL
jgi:hypothetical protein